MKLGLFGKMYYPPPTFAMLQMYILLKSSSVKLNVELNVKLNVNELVKTEKELKWVLLKKSGLFPFFSEF